MHHPGLIYWHWIRMESWHAIINCVIIRRRAAMHSNYLIRSRLITGALHPIFYWHPWTSLPHLAVIVLLSSNQLLCSQLIIAQGDCGFLILLWTWHLWMPIKRRYPSRRDFLWFSCDRAGISLRWEFRHTTGRCNASRTSLGVRNRTVSNTLRFLALRRQTMMSCLDIAFFSGAAID